MNNMSPLISRIVPHDPPSFDNSSSHVPLAFVLSSARKESGRETKTDRNRITFYIKEEISKPWKQIREPELQQWIENNLRSPELPHMIHAFLVTIGVMAAAAVFPIIRQGF
jgi:hypothetical protein